MLRINAFMNFILKNHPSSTIHERRTLTGKIIEVEDLDQCGGLCEDCWLL